MLPFLSASASLICNRFRIAEAASPEWKVGRGRWMEECGRGAAVEQLTARGMVSIPAMGGNSHTLYFEILLTSINPRDGGQ